MQPSHHHKSRIGVVIIGRNEGERLRACLESVCCRQTNVVYVDSGSEDESLSLASSFGAKIVELDTSVPFSAARARNAGFHELLDRSPTTQYVMFVDGDCQVASGWLETAEQALAADSELAVVFGRRRERFANASIYNRLCDIEWNSPIGEALSCGGDSVVRAESFEQVNGFNPMVVAGEEPELCFRLRQRFCFVDREKLQ